METTGIHEAFYVLHNIKWTIHFSKWLPWIKPAHPNSNEFAANYPAIISICVVSSSEVANMCEIGFAES